LDNNYTINSATINANLLYIHGHDFSYCCTYYSQTFHQANRLGESTILGAETVKNLSGQNDITSFDWSVINIYCASMDGWLECQCKRYNIYSYLCNFITTKDMDDSMNISYCYYYKWWCCWLVHIYYPAQLDILKSSDVTF